MNKEVLDDANNHVIRNPDSSQVNWLKRAIYNAYIRATDDFRAEIFNE